MIGVCYTYPRGGAPLELPSGVRSLSHLNFGTALNPVKPSVSAQTAKPSGHMCNFEPNGSTPVPLTPWVPILKDYWPSTGPCYAYGIDAGLKRDAGGTHDNPIDRLVRALRRPLPPFSKPQHAALCYDGYLQTGEDKYTQKAYHDRTAHRRDRLYDVGARTRTRSAFVIEVQRQVKVNDAYGSGLVLHDEASVRMQIKAAGGNDIIIFAGANTTTARARVDEAVLAAIGWAIEMKGNA